ncbi:ferredoxin-thioredoxin reductase catalytic domain-containing protein [Methanobacterium oryzae]|uniref:ferredoxin-thioredoxin reductase catalytic domain-containing protein n=1 Tax=Methanobacterium oryzae TaxID=69540 RepID=UPI003D1BF9C7
MSNEIGDEELENFYQKVKRDIEESGYHLNPDVEFTKYLLKNILLNEQRYGYGACPCRLAADNKEEDLDIICPCDYRDPDLNEYNTCYCGLYVSGDILEGKKKLQSIPERRPSPKEREQSKSEERSIISSLDIPVFRCSVCGYLCARQEPPEVCPICKVSKERFKRFI